MDLSRTITLQELRDLCYKYDLSHGSYPENEFEGQSVFGHVTESFAIENPDIYNNEKWFGDAVDKFGTDAQRAYKAQLDGST